MFQRYTKLFVVVAFIFWRFIADSDDIAGVDVEIAVDSVDSVGFDVEIAVTVDSVGFDVKIAVAVDSVGVDAAFAVDEDVTVVVVDVDLVQDLNFVRCRIKVSLSN